MITITRLLAKQLQLIVKKALKAARPLQLEIVAGQAGLRVRTQWADRAVEFVQPGALPEATLIVPFQLFADVKGSRPEAVTLTTPRKGVVVASWPNGDSVHRHEYKVAIPEMGAAFPEIPAKFTRQPGNLLAALAQANEVTDPSSARYALGCVQIDGNKRQIAATDGRQLLIQQLPELSIEGTLLVHGSEIFGCPALPEQQPILTGQTHKHFVLCVGKWKFFLPLNVEGRFPRVNDIVPNWQSAKTAFTIPPADASFLAANAKRLPAEGVPVCTLDLNGSVALRAKSIDSPVSTEIVLRNSQKAGEDVQVGIDRRNLLTALRFGFQSFHLSGPQAALLARDETRSYVWMPLENPELVRPSETTFQIESPMAHQSAPYRPNPSPPPTMPRIAPTTAAHATVPTTPASKPSRKPKNVGGTTLDQAIAVRDQFRSNLAAVKELVRSLKAEKRQHRLLKSTLASIRQLQNAA